MQLKCILLVFLLGIIPTSSHAASTSPSRVIDNLHGALLSTMKISEDLSARERYKKLEPIIVRAFNFDFMSMLASGTSWRKANKKDKSELINAFRRMSIATYAYRFKGYSGEDFRIIKTTPAARQTNLVFTKIITPIKNKQPEIIKLTYVTKKFGIDWKIIDILLNGGISELSVRHSEFRTILRTKGLSSLAQKLNKKADELIMD
jgi:phospholipid transport system substrate-binding protein